MRPGSTSPQLVAATLTYGERFGRSTSSYATSIRSPAPPQRGLYPDHPDQPLPARRTTTKPSCRWPAGSRRHARSPTLGGPPAPRNPTSHTSSTFGISSGSHCKDRPVRCRADQGAQRLQLRAFTRGDRSSTTTASGAAVNPTPTRRDAPSGTRHRRTDARHRPAAFT